MLFRSGVQDYFRDTYGRETHFVPNGVNRPETREAGLITEKFGLTKDSYILFLGRLVPEKGIRYLVEAFKDVKTDKKLVIAGGSSDTDSFMKELKELAKGDDRILFTGFVQGAMLDELYSNAYIYTLPSDLEGMPLSLLEAMSYGNACLVSDIPECTEVVEDKAIIFRKSNIKDLTEKLQDACDDIRKVGKLKEQAADFMGEDNAFVFECLYAAENVFFCDDILYIYNQLNVESMVHSYDPSYDQVGFYNNAEKIINIPMGIITALGTVMLPRMSNIVANGDKKRVEDRKSTRLNSSH